MSTAAGYFLLKQPRDTSHESERKVSASEQENPRAVQGYLTLGISTIVFQEKPVWIAYHHLVTAAVAYKDLPWEGPNIDANQYENEEPHQSYFVPKLPLSMVVQKPPRLPRKSSLRCRKCHACHAKDRGATSALLRRQASADFYGGTESTTPATQIEPEVPKVPRLPRKRPRRHISPTSSPSFRWPLWWHRKHHACHANRAWGAESATPATQKTAAPHQPYFVAKLPLTSMVAQKAPRLPRKSSLRCRKCHACHTKHRGATSVLLRRQASADIYGATQIEPEVPKLPRLPRKTPRRHISPTSSPRFRWQLWWYRKCHACHANRAWGAESATPATQKTAAPHQSYFVAKLPLTTMMVQKVPRLPRKSSLRCRKCHACHAKDRGATSVLLRRQASADLYGGTESTTPAMQIEPEVPKVPRLPRKRPRRHISPTSSPSFRWPLWWYRKYHACHANRARGVESDTPATPKTAAPHQSYFVAKLPLTSMVVQKEPRLPRKASLRCCLVCCIVVLCVVVSCVVCPVLYVVCCIVSHNVVCCIVSHIVLLRCCCCCCCCCCWGGGKGGGGGGEERSGRCRNKNKNPTTQCGEKERCPQWQYTSQKSFTIAALVGEENQVDLIQFHVATFPIFVFSVKVDEVLEQKVTSVAIVLERPCNLRNAWTVLRTGRASKGSKPKNPMNRLIWLENELVTKIRRVE